MNTYLIGQRAEAVGASFLRGKGCTILQQNWRTRWCEIDIVARRDDIIYFCEVKYRSHNRQGVGLDYITPKKLRQMRFAAEFWLAEHAWRGDWQLCAIEVSGPAFRITAVIRDI